MKPNAVSYTHLVVLEEALFCQSFILGSRSTVVVVGVD